MKSRALSSGIAILLISSFAMGAEPTTKSSIQEFFNITDKAGIQGPSGEGETGGHAAAFTDVDNDGLPDLYITMLFDRPTPDLFFHNLGDGRFVEEAAARGVADHDGGSHGACFADLDSDGDYDLINGATLDLDGNPARINIYRNNGKGVFVKVSDEAGIPMSPTWPTRAVLALDIDADGDLDIFSVSNAYGSEDPPDERNEVYRNEGNMRFTPVDGGDLATAPCGQGAVATDFDGDGDVDVFVANRTGKVNILVNDGSGMFQLTAPESLGFQHFAKDGVSSADVDADGDIDILLTGDDEGYLYKNMGNGRFELAQSFTGTDGYMGTFGDMDNDGDMDLVFAGCGHVWLNDGHGSFTEGPGIPLGDTDDPRAVALADIDQDGDLDIAIACKRSGNQMIRNDQPSGHWLKIRLTSPQGQAGAFGAKVTLHPAGQANSQILGMREAQGSNGYLGQNDPLLHFGLGAHEKVDVRVRFLDGSEVIRGNVPADNTIHVNGE